MRARTALITAMASVCSMSPTDQSRQCIPPSELEDQLLGWIRTYNYKDATLPITLDHRVYSAAQLTNAQQFANWMQAGCLPKGALGDVLQIRGCSSATYELRATDPSPTVSI